MTNRLGTPEHAAFQRADDAWGAELRRIFGKHAGDARYTKEGKGANDSQLRQLYDAREVARIAWDRSCGLDERGFPLNRTSAEWHALGRTKAGNDISGL